MKYLQAYAVKLLRKLLADKPEMDQKRWMGGKHACASVVLYSDIHKGVQNAARFLSSFFI